MAYMHDLHVCNPLSAAFITTTGNKVTAQSWHVSVPKHVHIESMFASVHVYTLTCMQSVPGKACSKSSNSTCYQSYSDTGCSVEQESKHNVKHSVIW